MKVSGASARGNTASGNAAERLRDIRSLLTRLAHGATLRRGPARHFVLVESEVNAPAPPEKTVAGELVEAGLAQDWLERDSDRLRLSHAGRAWLRRCAAEGDAFRAQHQLRGGGEREIDGTRRRVLVNEAESPLGWLKSRKDRNGQPLLTEQQYEAGERLRADYWFAQMSPRVTANWSALAPSERSRRGGHRQARPIFATR